MNRVKFDSPKKLTFRTKSVEKIVPIVNNFIEKENGDILKQIKKEIIGF